MLGLLNSVIGHTDTIYDGAYHADKPATGDKRTHDPVRSHKSIQVIGKPLEDWISVFLKRWIIEHKVILFSLYGLCELK